MRSFTKKKASYLFREETKYFQDQIRNKRKRDKENKREKDRK